MNGLNGIAKTFAIPNLFTKSVQPSDTNSPVKLIAESSPSIPNASTIDASPAFTNLADLANYRLKNSNVNGNVSPSIAVPNIQNSPLANANFFIPKFNTTNQSPNCGSSGERLTPHEMSLKKIMEMRKLRISDDRNSVQSDGSMEIDQNNQFSSSVQSISSTESNANVPNALPSISNNSLLIDTTNFVVDLSAALLAKDDKITAPIKFIPEDFEVKFVDCELSASSALQTVITKDCEIDVSHLLNIQLNNRTQKTSQFGKILCTKFRCKRMPYVGHEFHPKHNIVPFAFNTINSIRRINVKRDDI